MGFFPVIDFFSESYFPYLTRLSLTKCEGVDVLDINCPYLVYLDLNHTEIEKLMLKTPRLLTLCVLRCFTEENEGVTLVDIWAPKLQVFQWKDNLVPSSFYIWDPKHVNTSEVSLLSLDVDEARVESFTNLLSVLCMVKTFRIGDDFLVLLAKLDFYGIHTRLSKSLLELSLQTAMTKKSILGLWFLLRMSHALRYLDVLITEHTNAEDNNNWGRDMLDTRNISKGGFWTLQSQFQAPFLRNLEKVKIDISKDAEKRNISFICFLLQRCKGLKYFEIIKSHTVSSVVFRNSLWTEMGSSKAASPDVKILVRTNKFMRIKTNNYQ